MCGAKNMFNWTEAKEQLNIEMNRIYPDGNDCRCENVCFNNAREVKQTYDVSLNCICRNIISFTNDIHRFRS